MYMDEQELLCQTRLSDMPRERVAHVETILLLAITISASLRLPPSRPSNVLHPLIYSAFMSCLLLPYLKMLLVPSAHH